MTIRVLICDELPVIGDGLRTLLDAVPDIDVIGTTDNGMEAIVLVRTSRPDVVVTDLSLRTISGLELIRRLGKEDTPPHIVVFTRSDAGCRCRCPPLPSEPCAPVWSSPSCPPPRSPCP
ncbi:response regulator transcription factor, partial [Streptomyces sp. NPDC051132]|uniref:response regulator n=1 Tax=Streptomyces sp. NPDC051132 TaxID=3155667 RepID=UPI00343B9592